MFEYPPTPEVLHWLAQGRLADRRSRTIRLWTLLCLIYGNPGQTLPRPFRYADICDRLFAKTHGRSNHAPAAALSANCNATCRCQQSVITLLEESSLPHSIAGWQQGMVELTDLSHKQLKAFLQQRPFATVHRSIRDDLTYLAETGWLTSAGQGRFFTKSSQQLPQLPAPAAAASLSVTHSWEVLRSLESISFIQPNLEVVVQTLWEQLTAQTSKTTASHNIKPDSVEPEKRIFIHLDYILSPAMQEQVDTLQEQIEQLWREGSGVIQFDYSPAAERAVPITVYPVCLHYARRAKYLSAYGTDPAGVFGWHNYRLDRILSARLKILGWKDLKVPKQLRAMHRDRTLPTPAMVSTALEEAWGFNFYLPRRLLIMRFPPNFAQRYVQQTDRHATFEPIAYKKLLVLVKQQIQAPDAQATVLKILSQQTAKDAYYKAWIRLGDINIVMRLRDWRPKGEVIAPLELRQQMRREAQAELEHYS